MAKETEKSYLEIDVKKLTVNKAAQLRFALSEEAIARYTEWFQEGRKSPALKVWQSEDGSYAIIDGFHRREAAIRAGIKKLGCEVLDVPKDDLLALAYRFNRDHGVPLSRAERDRIIVKLRVETGKTQEEIGKAIGLSQNRISEILHNSGADELQRTALDPDEQRSIIKLILAEKDTQAKIAETFNVDPATVSRYKSHWWQYVQSTYESGKLKSEVSKEVDLEMSEVDSILRDHRDEEGNPAELLNFTPQESTLWPSFGIDNRFGKRHPGNVPALLVKNLLCRLTKPGDHVLDPLAGGGVVIDACADMVGRTCDAFDLNPVRDDIKPWNILKGPPPVSKPPNLVFLDPPYGPRKAGEYQPKAHDYDLANMSVPAFLRAMKKVFGYWDKGTLICLISNSTVEGIAYPRFLVADMVEVLRETGWRESGWVVNHMGRPESVSQLSVSRMESANWWRREDLHILIGNKDGRPRRLEKYA